MRRVLYDLSPAITSDTPVWPGDVSFSAGWSNRLERGDSVNLSSITATVHLAAHADAPLHTEADGVAIDGMALEPYLGRCRVLHVPGTGPVELGEVEETSLDADSPRRLLLRTGCRWDQGFPTRFRALAPELAAALVARGTVLLGTDAPSVDPADSTELPAHHRLLSRGIAILEGLDLATVPEGDYELISLPLRLSGLDASPVRAVLCALD